MKFLPKFGLKQDCFWTFVPTHLIALVRNTSFQRNYIVTKVLKWLGIIIIKELSKANIEINQIGNVYAHNNAHYKWLNGGV